MKKTIKKSDIGQSKIEAGSNPPSVISDAEVQACLDHLKAIHDVLAPYAVTLTAPQRKSSTKLRKGGDKVIPLMSRLATNGGVSGAAFDVDAMQTQMELAKALLPLLTSAKTLADTLGDTVLSANGKAWASATTLHGVLKRLAKDKPEMRRDMEVVSAAFALRPRTAKTAAPPKDEASNDAGANVDVTPKVDAAPKPLVPQAPAA